MRLKLVYKLQEFLPFYGTDNAYLFQFVTQNWLGCIFYNTNQKLVDINNRKSNILIITLFILLDRNVCNKD